MRRQVEIASRRRCAPVFIAAAALICAASPGYPQGIEKVDKPYVESWEIRTTDGTLSRALSRWANLSGNLPLLWEASKDLPAISASYSGEFLSAIEQVMQDSRRSQFPLHACAYDNAIRVLHVSQSCDH